MDKIIIFGATGGLGTELVKLMQDKYEVVPVSSSQVDIRNFEAVNKFFSENEANIVINCTGYNYDSFLHKIDNNNISAINKVIDVNVLGSLNIASCALKMLRKQNYGRMIFISSILSRKVMMGTAAYSASKAFIDNLVKTASAENIGKGITCNSIQLGYFDAGMCHRLPPQVQEEVMNTIPLKRWGKIEELYSTIEYLIRTEYITGQNIEISGGL